VDALPYILLPLAGAEEYDLDVSNFMVISITVGNTENLGPGETS
jgi:hypothetical protein